MESVSATSQLANHLGSANDSARLFSFARRMADDETECYPTEAIESLNSFGLSHYYVPPQFGGKLHTIDQLAALLRIVSQRDLSVSISHGITFLGCAAVWMSGEPAQQAHFAQAVLAGDLVAMGLTEEASGSDLLNMATTAYMNNSHGYQLIGKKWLVNGAHHNRFVIVYAQTKQQRSPRGYSLFLFDKLANPTEFTLHPKIKTLGTRSADISAISFDAALAPERLVGKEGFGFETILKALQLSRTLCGSLSLGALDTGLDIVLNFALNRSIYGKQVAQLAQSQKLLTEVWATMLIGDSLNHVVLRGLQAVPEQASIHSSVVKYLIPTLVEQAMDKLAVVHGARYYLREGDNAGIFQKMLRDNLLVSLFDGSTQVNLHSLSFQLSAVAQQQQHLTIPDWIKQDLSQQPFDWTKLELSARGEDHLFFSFQAGLASLSDRLTSGSNQEENRWFINTLNVMSQAYEQLLADLLMIKPDKFVAGDPILFDLAKRYCVLSAAAAVFAQHKINDGLLTRSLADHATLAVVLQQLTHLLGHKIYLPVEYYQTAFANLINRWQFDGKFTLFC